MASQIQKNFALDKAIELTAKALQANDKVNQIDFPEDVAAFLETIYAKLIELQEGE